MPDVAENIWRDLLLRFRWNRFTTEIILVLVWLLSLGKLGTMAAHSETKELYGIKQNGEMCFSAKELEFLAEDEMIEIIPRFSFQEIGLLSGSIGPFQVIRWLTCQLPWLSWLSCVLSADGSCPSTLVAGIEVAWKTGQNTSTGAVTKLSSCFLDVQSTAAGLASSWWISREETGRRSREREQIPYTHWVPLSGDCDNFVS